MQIKLFGTRGSIPISNPKSVRYGGNTTSLRILTQCLPKGHALVVDTGSGYMPLSCELLEEGIMSIGLIFTHYHHDHTQGLVLAPHTFIPAATMYVWGPKEHGVGPQEVFQTIMQSPGFPVQYAIVRHRFQNQPLENIGTQVLVIHPEGGISLVPVHIFEKADSERKQMPIGKTRHPISECLVIRMYKTVHPEYTVSYRFEERPTGRTFVFLTDHECTRAIPLGLKKHLTGAHLLIQDAQYSEERYVTQTAGYGHGTPAYCVETAIAAGVEHLGLTHHDPMATDEDVDKRLAEARELARNLGKPELAEHIFACADYQTVTV
jgi:phosphoribosyl 1,2-cyclic phosphodiesterase